ncbi:hypothetical protein HNQ40_000981 [Algisphaera agarilytica]|uniref:Uncharacterized protein n=2 Tax=Algisphaera agarilytica TaxID=1385975 RepID=A0A7X0H7D9_9BACT|nr:hypothetical protein [Algisphaera agarilytica]
MGLKKLIQENSAVVLVVSMLMLVLAGWRIMSQGSTELPDYKWMYDLNRQVLVQAPRSSISPLVMDSGVYEFKGMGEAGAVVDVGLYACGGTPKLKDGMSLESMGDKGVRIVFLSRHPDSVLPELEAKGYEAMPEPPVLYSDATGEEWVWEGSSQGEAIFGAISTLCDGERGRMILY